jgi:syntaxin 16
MQGRSDKPKPLISSFGQSSSLDEDDELDSVFTDAQTQAMENTERMIDQRDKEISEVVKSINGLATIFKDLQTMVIDQGTVLDRIDYNIEQVAVYTEDAHTELVKASKYQSNKKAKYCIALLVVVIVVLLLAIIIKPRRRS